MPRHVTPRAVHLGGVLPREASSPMRAYSAIGVHDYLPPCQARVSKGATYDEPSRRVDKDLRVFVQQLRGYHLPHYLLRDIAGDLFFRGIFLVLGSHHHSVDPHGLSLVVLNRNL